MTTTPTPNDQSKGLTPDGLVNQLFDVAIMHNQIKDPREAARQVIDFLAASLFYAVESTKSDVLVFLAETIIVLAAKSCDDEPSRKELLKHIGETIANAPPLPANPSAAPPATPPAGR